MSGKCEECDNCGNPDCQSKSEVKDKHKRLIKIDIFAESKCVQAIEFLIKYLKIALSMAKTCLPDSKKFGFQITEVILEPDTNISSSFFVTTSSKIKQTQPDS